MSDCVQDSLWDSWLACQRGQFQGHGGGGEVFGDRGCVNYEKEWLLEEVEDVVQSGRKRKKQNI